MGNLTDVVFLFTGAAPTPSRRRRQLLTSLLSGFVVFAFLGHLAMTRGVDVADVAEGGWSLAFVVYPSAFASFGVPGGQIFATLFWVALTLGVDSAFGEFIFIFVWAIGLTWFF